MVIEFNDTYYLSHAVLSRGTLKVSLCKMFRLVFVLQLPSDPVDDRLS